MKKLLKQYGICPICKKKYIYYGYMIGGMFFLIDRKTDPTYIMPYDTKECFEEAKKRGLWK
jgi:hypothetical protein